MPTATESNSSNSNALLFKVLSFNQAFVVFILLALWLTALLFMLVVSQITSPIFPGLLIFSSSILWLFLLLKKFQTSIKATLLIHQIGFKWILLSLSVGVIYWYFDQWLFQKLSSTSLEVDIRSWQKQIQEYQVLTVFISTVTLAPVFEELVFRGLLLQALQKKIATWLAILLSSLIFALIHWSWPEFISLMMVGCLYALLVHQSKTILTAILAHITHNALTFWQYASF